MSKLFSMALLISMGSGAHGVGADLESQKGPLLNKYGNPITGYFVDHNRAADDGRRLGFEFDESEKVKVYLDYLGLPPIPRQTISLENGTASYTNAKAELRLSFKENGFRTVEVKVEVVKRLDTLIKYYPETSLFQAVQTQRWTPREDSALLTYTSKKFATKAELLQSMREKMAEACTANQRSVEEKATVCEVSYPAGKFDTASDTQYFECAIVYQCH